MIQRNYGWKKQVEDHRDFKMRDLRAVKSLVVSLPSAVNLRKWCSEVQDQGQLGSCTANAWAGLLQYNENKYPVVGRKYFNMSRLFIYYNERVIGNTVNEDSGAQIRDGAKAIATYGSCAEYDWFYDESKFTIKPSPACYKVAFPNHIHSYYSLDGINSSKTLTNLKTCIASGQPFVFGFNVYSSFEAQEMADTGIMQMPTSQELKDGPVGGHAVMAVGYDDATQRFLVRNSWGAGWGLKGINGGYFTMPYDFISDHNQASDFWTVVKEI